MSWVKTLVVALAAETAGYFLSLSWGFLLLTAAFIVTGVRLQSASAKAADTEKRMNALVPQVGAAKDSAASAQTAATNANNNANGRVAKSGDTMSGGLTVGGDLHSNGANTWVDGGLTVGASQLVEGNITSHGNIYGNGLNIQGSPIGPVTGPTPPGSGVTWNDSQLTNCVHAIIDTLVESGIYW